MDAQKTKNLVRFITSVTVYQIVTYYLAGIIASLVFNYKEIFLQPIIRDYFKEYGSVEIYIGPLLQVVRGILFALVLLPLRDFLQAKKLGWLWLWLIFIGIGILGTPAASPASMEGLIYTKLPVWFHAIGLPEIVLQTLAFSFLVHRYLRKSEHPLPTIVQNMIKSLVSTCMSFIGYTIVSLIFAFSAGISVQQGGANLMVLGQFIGPLVVTFCVILFGARRWWLQSHIAMYVLSAASLALYQQFILGSAGLVYVLVAPIIPVFISALLSKPRLEQSQ